MNTTCFKKKTTHTNTRAKHNAIQTLLGCVGVTTGRREGRKKSQERIQRKFPRSARKGVEKKR